ncbi:hypothetical protein [Streptomyces sp. NPDC006551]|uniref:hypothetical protein n=1 Tax=Streptomyces sp. NPDC006551 TaxID=3157178 RepID=UPI0033B45F5B
MTAICLELHTVLVSGAPGHSPTRQLVSLGMASADGRRFYAVNADVPLQVAIEQLPRKVWSALPLLQDPILLDRLDPDVVPLKEMKAAFEAFLGQLEEPEFWSMHGNADHSSLTDVFGYDVEALLPDHFPRWISSVREYRARVLDRVGQQNPERLRHLQQTGEGVLWPLFLPTRCAFKNAHRVLTILQRTEQLAGQSEVSR